jgi:4-hydroxybenzoate polyprenyltransferase
LPFRADVVQFLREEKAAGRRLVLATASWQDLAAEVAAHVGLFDRVLATNERQNLKSAVKAEAIRIDAGGAPFEYLGNSRADRPVWQLALAGHVVGNEAEARKLSRDGKLGRVFPTGGAWSPVAAAVRGARVHQWAKNLLLFLPLLGAHRIADPGSVTAALVAFAAFCLMSSGTYFANDLLDLESDRVHPTKRDRPVAAGGLHLSVAVALAVLLPLASILLASVLPAAFRASLLLYLATTLCYSLILKRVAVVDVITLASLYALRVIAGALAIAAPLSFWMLAFCLFLFFSLALLKRYAEIHSDATGATGLLPGRGYSAGDASLVQSLGTTSGMLSVLVLALYVNGETARVLYSSPDVLWLLCPAHLFWVSRAWLLASHGRMHEDPVLFAIKDSGSYLTAAVAGAVIWAAI